jgi:hypothetical protein
LSGSIASVRAKSHLALMHYPMMDRIGQKITSAITALDLHDFSRLTRTYGLGGVFAQTNLPQQVALIGRLMGHWVDGSGGEMNPHRKIALELLEMVDSLEAAVKMMADAYGEEPVVIATSARDDGPRVSFKEAGERLIEANRPALVLFGTGSGMAPELLECADWVLEPIGTPGDYNHLSVRSAASIIVDRLFGRE